MITQRGILDSEEMLVVTITSNKVNQLVGTTVVTVVDMVPTKDKVVVVDGIAVVETDISHISTTPKTGERWFSQSSG